MEINPLMSPDDGSPITYVTWDLSGPAATAAPIESSAYADRAILFGAAGGTGFEDAVFVFEGSDVAAPGEADWQTFKDFFGEALLYNAGGGLEQISKLTRWIRPRVTSGTPGPQAVAILALRKS